MKQELLFFILCVMWCVGIRLSPMENNDKLQHITNLFVAEWQWESWPVKQDMTEQEEKTPGQRKNVALWRDSSKSAWYLFGGQPINGDSKKVYSDIWKFTVKTRVWKKIFSSRGIEETFTKKRGPGVFSGFTNLNNTSDFKSNNKKISVCGVLEKNNVNNSESMDMWSSFKRKKVEDKQNDDVLLYLAVYTPKEFNSNTVWQIDLKKKLWTANDCCCNFTQNETDTKIPGLKKKEHNMSETLDTIINSTKNESYIFDYKINSAEDNAENEQQHLNFSNIRSKKKKINQIRKTNEKLNAMQVKVEKKAGKMEEKNKTESKSSERVDDRKNKHADLKNITEKVKGHLTKPKPTAERNEKKHQTEKFDKPGNFKIVGKHCRNSSKGETSVVWCDEENAAFVTANINSSGVTIQVFNLTRGQWSQLQVINDEEAWKDCKNKNLIRYAGNEEEVYIICSQSEQQNNVSNKSSQDYTNVPEIPSKTRFNIKLAYKINYKERKLRSLGKILLSPFFNSVEGEKVWQNETQSLLEVVRNSENETILILAYLDMVDLWILNKNRDYKQSFELVEKVWRGSALKWFDKYNAALYNLLFVTESGSSDTVLLPNPRNIEANEYWPRERGRFIIRLFKNENLKNESFENRTRDQNLTYQLLQSDYKPNDNEHQLNQMYSLKVLVFFGISLAIFTAFGLVVFLKKCVSCPPKIRIRNECHKSPLIIRYSVIPDDLLYPVA